MSAELAASGVISLLTDFGTRDPFVGVMKGVIWGRFPGARIADLTHEIAPQSIATAAFWLERSFEWFPAGTVHVAVVDPGVGTSRAILAALVRGQAFIAPDNGLLGPILREEPGAPVHRVDLANLGAFGLRTPSATFHGRDVFAPLAAELASGRAGLAALGPAAAPEAAPALAPAADDGAAIAGEVVAIDRFGNLITAVRSRELAPLREPRVEIAGRSLALARTYGDASRGTLIALVNSFDVVEIACAGASAAELLGASVGARVLVRGV